MRQFGLGRRTFLQGVGVTAPRRRRGLEHAGSTGAAGAVGRPGTDLPKLKMPADACDCHHHIYDGRFPIAPLRDVEGRATPSPPTTGSCKKRTGTTRSVVVQPSTYGTDNSCTLDGMATLGSATTRGVAVVDNQRDRCRN